MKLTKNTNLLTLVAAFTVGLTSAAVLAVFLPPFVISFTAFPVWLAAFARFVYIVKQDYPTPDLEDVFKAVLEADVEDVGETVDGFYDEWFESVSHSAETTRKLAEFVATIKVTMIGSKAAHDALSDAVGPKAVVDDKFESMTVF